MSKSKTPFLFLFCALIGMPAFGCRHNSPPSAAVQGAEWAVRIPIGSPNVHFIRLSFDLHGALWVGATVQTNPDTAEFLLQSLTMEGRLGQQTNWPLHLNDEPVALDLIRGANGDLTLIGFDAEKESYRVVQIQPPLKVGPDNCAGPLIAAANAQEPRAALAAGPDGAFLLALIEPNNKQHHLSLKRLTSDGRQNSLASILLSYPKVEDVFLNGLAIGREGDITAVGTIYFPGKAGFIERNIIVHRLNAAGQELWRRRYEGPENNRHMAAAIALDAAENLYVVGSSATGQTNYDFLLLKYSPNGDLLWEARYNGPSNNYDYAYALALDHEGYIAVTGRSFGGATANDDLVTAVFDSTGKLVFSDRWTSSPTGIERGQAIAFDASGNLFVAGSIGGVETSLVILKYSRERILSPAK